MGNGLEPSDHNPLHVPVLAEMYVIYRSQTARFQVIPYGTKPLPEPVFYMVLLHPPDHSFIGKAIFKNVFENYTFRIRVTCPRCELVDYIPCIQRIGGYCGFMLKLPAICCLPYKWCKQNNSKGTESMDPKFGAHIGCDSAMSWLQGRRSGHSIWKSDDFGHFWNFYFWPYFLRSSQI